MPLDARRCVSHDARLLSTPPLTLCPILCRRYDGVDRTLKTAQWSAVSGRILWAHGSSLDDEISAVTGSDIHLVVISFVLMAVFAAAALFNKSPVKSKTSLAMSGVGVVMLSILAAYGLCMFFGIMFTPLSQVGSAGSVLCSPSVSPALADTPLSPFPPPHPLSLTYPSTRLPQLLPFILVGVGLDDIFVLITGLDEVRAKHPELADLRSQLVETMRTFGVSISVTSSTNLLAFALGAATRIPSVQAFCAYAGLAIIIDFALQISLFLAVLIFNERRTAANKLDWVCCITVS